MVPICLVFGASLGSLCSHDLFREIGAKFRGSCSRGRGFDRLRSSRRWRFDLADRSLGQPPRNTRPFVFQRVPTDKQSEMATGGNRRFDIARPRARERRRRQDLPRRRDQVSIAGEEKQRAAQLTQIDKAAECAEPSCGDAILAKEPVEYFQEIRPGKIERPPLPAQEGLGRSGIFFVCGRPRELKRVDDERGLVVLPRPEIEQSTAENQSISGSDYIVDQRFWRLLRPRRRDGRLRPHVDWRTGKHETPHLSRETRSVDQREPTTLA